MPTFSVSAFFPAYNEAASLEGLVKAADGALRATVRDFEIIIINDGSRDSTADVLRQLQQTYPRLCVVSHATNLGYGSAIRSGFRAATKDLVFFSDADQQFDLKEIRLLLEHIDGSDAVIGYRRQRRDGAGRRFAAWGWNRLVAILFGLPYRDIDCAFKLFRRAVLERVNAGELQSTGAMVSAELLIKLRAAHARIVEVPVSHFPREHGQATGVRPAVMARALYELGRFFWTSRGRKI